MYLICTIYLPYMYLICTLYVPYIYLISTLYVPYMYHIATLYVPYIYLICTLYVPYIYLIYPCVIDRVIESTPGSYGNPWRKTKFPMEIWKCFPIYYSSNSNRALF